MSCHLGWAFNQSSAVSAVGVGMRRPYGGVSVGYDPAQHRRRSIRLPAYDYAQPGAYFVTLCTHKRALLFGDVVGDRVALNAYGRIAHDEWLASPQIRRELELDAFVVMPNHIHGLVWIVSHDVEVAPASQVGAHGRAPLQRTSRSLGAFIAGYKSAVTKGVNALRNTPGAPVWQRNYWEHVVRTEEILEAIRRYIADNPARWALDRYHPTPAGPNPHAAELWRLLQGET